LLATNTGSLFQLAGENGRVLAFASERFILHRLLEDRRLGSWLGRCRVDQIRAASAVAVRLRDLHRHAFSLAPSLVEDSALTVAFTPNDRAVTIVDQSSRPDQLKRCAKCILPETYPFIDFDESGVCRYCREWTKITPKGEQALIDAVAPFRSTDGSPDVI